jgi:hypothetical protein
MSEKSLPLPTAYDQRAISFIEQNQHKIQAVGRLVNVSPTALAGSIARETTSSDRGSLLRRIGRKLGHVAERFYSEERLEIEYQETVENVTKKPGAMDGNPALGYISEPVRRDMGPGSIKLYTAMRIIQQYVKTPEGKAAGFGQYGPHDLKKVMRDLWDPNNPLTINVEGFVIREGQAFFAGKTIDGVNWEALSQQQKDAALTAYSTLGEHAVAADMKAGAFHPFTTGPKGGKVGAWIYFGHNYAALGAALKGNTKGLRMLGAMPSIAPVKKWPRGALRFGAARPLLPQSGMSGAPKLRLAAGQRHAAFVRPLGGMTFAVAADVERRGGPVTSRGAGGIARAAMLPAGALSKLARGQIAGDSVRYAAGRPVGSVAPAAVVVQPHAAGNTVSVAVGTMPGDNQTRLPGRRAFSGPASFGLTRASGSAGSTALARRALPSIAPTGTLTTRRGHHDVRADRRGDVAQHVYDGPRDMTADRSEERPVTESDVARMVRDCLDRQGRLPPSGATGFDPRLTPAWAGLKLAV